MKIAITNRMRLPSVLLAVFGAVLGTFLAAPAHHGVLVASPPKDNRQVVEDTSKGPARFVGQVRGMVRLAGNQYATRDIGTGVLIGPRHVLTAAHMIWQPALKGVDDEGVAGFWDGVNFIPGANGIGSDKKSAPFGAYKVVGIRMQRPYQAAVKATADLVARGALQPADYYYDVNLDLAVLVLNKDVEGIGAGFFQPVALTDADITRHARDFKLNGYDGDQLGIGVQVTRSLSIFAQRYRYRNGSQVSVWLSDDAFSFKGASGGPVWFLQNGTPMVVGVHHGGRHGGKAGKSGVLLDDFYIKWIRWATDSK